MRPEPGKSKHRERALLLAVVAIAGLVTLVGSGGGDLSTNPPPGYATVIPQRIALQVGGTVTYSVDTSETGALTYQWLRSSDGGQSFAVIAGATSPTYTLNSVNLSDDAALFEVDVHSRSGAVLVKWASRLAVSSMPGLVFQDGEFATDDWLVSADTTTSPNPPVHSEEQVASGGNPGAFRQMSHQTEQGSSAVRSFHFLKTATYAPATQGAIYVIDYTEDCIALSNPRSLPIDTSLAMEQGSRRYIAHVKDYCQSSTWVASKPRSALARSDFELYSGAPCGTGESCPDLSALGAPLRFGYTRYTRNPHGPPSLILHGIDNWTVTVWRH